MVRRGEFEHRFCVLRTDQCRVEAPLHLDKESVQVDVENHSGRGKRGRRSRRRRSSGTVLVLPSRCHTPYHGVCRESRSATRVGGTVRSGGTADCSDTCLFDEYSKHANYGRLSPQDPYHRTQLVCDSRCVALGALACPYMQHFPGF